MSVRTACLVIEEDSHGGEGPAAFMPIAGMPLIERVAHRLAGAGFEQIVLLAPAPCPVLKRIAADLKQRGLSVPIVRTVGDLADYIRADRSLLIVQDGVLPSRQLVEDATARRVAVIFTRPVASSDDRHERIDLADRWAGLAVVPGSLVHDLDPQPEDWSAGSALLRKAVQHGIDRVGLDIKRGTGRRADMLVAIADCKGVEQRMLSDYFTERTGQYRGLLPTFSKWIAKRALPYFWHANVTDAKLGLALLAAAALTLVFAIAGLIVAALVLGLVTLLGQDLFRHHLAFIAGRRGRTDSETGLIAMIMLIAAVPVAAIATFGPTLVAVCAGAILPLALFAAFRIGVAEPRGRWQMDGFSAALLVLVLVLSGIGVIPALLATSALTLSLGLLPAMRDAVKGALTPKS